MWQPGRSPGPGESGGVLSRERIRRLFPSPAPLPPSHRTRTVLDIFNCSPTVPPDGHQYLQVVFVRCGTGLQSRLMPIAVVYLLAYTIGYPLVVSYVVLKNRLLIMEDQVCTRGQLL